AMKGSGFTLDFRAGTVSISDADTSFAYNSEGGAATSSITNWNFARGPPSLQPDYFDLSANSGATVTLGGFGTVGVSTFDVTRQTGVSATVVDSAVAPATTSSVTGSLFTIALTNVSVDLGSGGASLVISGGNLDLASLSVTASVSYLAAAGDSFQITDAKLGPVGFSSTGVSFLYNSGSPAAAVTDWSFTGLPAFAAPATVAAGLVRVSGGQTTFTVAGLGSLSVDTFQVTSQQGVAATVVDSAVAPATTSSVTGSLFTVALTNVSVDLGSGGASLVISGGNLDLASLSVSASVSYLAAAGDSFQITDAKLGPVGFSSTGVSFLYNSGSPAAAVTDWSFTGLPAFAAPATVAAGLVRVSGGQTTFTVAGLGSLSVDTFQVTSQQGVAATVVDSAVAPATTSSVTGSLFTVALTNVSVDLGSGGASLTVSGGNLDLASLSVSASVS